jgi:hypothetical protein
VTILLILTACFFPVPEGSFETEFFTKYCDEATSCNDKVICVGETWEDYFDLYGIDKKKCMLSHFDRNQADDCLRGGWECDTATEELTIPESCAVVCP